MRSWIKLWFAICTSVALTACTFGNGHICGPQTPAAYCDREAYQELTYPKPYLEKWDKSAMAPEGRRQDSADCGGGNSDHPGFSQKNIKAAQRFEETENETDSRLFHDWERCMLKKGYRYTGKCYDNEISRASPACGAR